MLCGNKCDLRDEYIREGRKVVSRESGQRLAKVSVNVGHDLRDYRLVLKFDHFDIL
jgi:hypothetical protein